MNGSMELQSWRLWPWCGPLVISVPPCIMVPVLPCAQSILLYGMFYWMCMPQGSMLDGGLKCTAVMDRKR